MTIYIATMIFGYILRAVLFWVLEFFGHILLLSVFTLLFSISPNNFYSLSQSCSLTLFYFTLKKIISFYFYLDRVLKWEDMKTGLEKEHSNQLATYGKREKYLVKKSTQISFISAVKMT